MKKLLSILLVVLMIVSIVPLSVSAESVTGECGAQGDNLTWTLDTETGCLVIEGVGEMQNFVGDIIPSWLDYNNSITQVIIENGVTTIGDYAFYHYKNIESVEVADTVTRIGICAFGGCNNLNSIELPENLTSLGGSAFYYCENLKQINIPRGLTSIEQYTFCACDFNSIIIPPNITTIKNNAFHSCKSLEAIELPENLESLGQYAFYYCTNLKTIVIPSGVSTIEHGTFGCCENLENVVLYNNISTIESSAFYDCTNLATIHYIGSKENWDSITINNILNTSLQSATKHYDCLHTNAIHSTCNQKGYTEGVYCPTCDSWVFGHTEKPLLNHTYTSEVTKEATHLEEGETTYTCACGDTYTEVIEKLTGHTYEKAVTAPTCTAKGYTTYTCECGDTYVDDYTDKLDHEYTSEITTKPTHLTEGIKTFTCNCGDSYTETVAKLEGHTYTSEVTKKPTHLEEGEITYSCACGDTYTEEIAKLTAHTYEEVVTAPTCTAKGYTTYTCACGDTYISDYIGMIAHNYSSSITTPATHLTEGVKTYTCSDCGNGYTEKIAKTPQHTYITSKVTKPSCTDKGYTSHYCECGYSYNDNYTSATGHKYNGQTCVNCGKKCSCNCHKSGFMGFIWKIILFFNKLFKTNKTCACGVSHY